MKNEAKRVSGKDDQSESNRAMNELTRDRIFGLIMAGGQGTRLWPLTIDGRPKAFLSFDGTGVSLLQRTISRLSRLTVLENIFVVAGRTHERELRSQDLSIPGRNVILEPVGRSTLPCIGLAGLYVRRRDACSMMMVVPGEQLVEDEAEFQRLMMRAAEIAGDHNCIVTLGIRPTTPATRFGYIQLGSEVSCESGIHAFRVRGFTEKPDERKASDFLSSGNYLWNSGIFIWPTSLLFGMISRFAPDIYDALSAIDGAIGTPEEKQTIERAYSDMRSISIDYAIMERAEDTLVIPADMGWNDMGTWPEVAEVWEKDDHSNACFGQHVSIDSAGCVIYSPGKLVATVGVQDLIVVETPDALLLCAKDRADDVKRLVQSWPRRDLRRCKKRRKSL
jgi:mannose-1-phosphate guanylyltransferase